MNFLAANYPELEKQYCQMSLQDKRKLLEGSETNPKDVENLLGSVR